MILVESCGCADVTLLSATLRCPQLQVLLPPMKQELVLCTSRRSWAVTTAKPSERPSTPVGPCETWRQTHQWIYDSLMDLIWSHPFQKNKHTDLKKLWWYWTGLSHFFGRIWDILNGRRPPSRMGWMGRMGFMPPRSFQDALYPGLGTEPDEGDAAAAGLRQDDWYGGHTKGGADVLMIGSIVQIYNVFTAPVVTPAVVNVRVCCAS